MSQLNRTPVSRVVCDNCGTPDPPHTTPKGTLSEWPNKRPSEWTNEEREHVRQLVYGGTQLDVSADQPTTDESCPTCGKVGADTATLDHDSGRLEADCGDEWHDRQVDVSADQSSTRCEACDHHRRFNGTPQLVGDPCDICAGRGFDYLGRPCRHCAQIDAETKCPHCGMSVALRLTGEFCMNDDCPGFPKGVSDGRRP